MNDGDRDTTATSTASTTATVNVGFQIIRQLVVYNVGQMVEDVTVTAESVVVIVRSVSLVRVEAVVKVTLPVFM